MYHYLLSLWLASCPVSAGGFYFPGNPKDYSEFIEELPAAPHNSSLYDLYQAHVDAGCAASNKDHQYMCGPANVAFLFPYIKVSRCFIWAQPVSPGLNGLLHVINHDLRWKYQTSLLTTWQSQGLVNVLWLCMGNKSAK